jgi:hypothetical protein
MKRLQVLRHNFKSYHIKEKNQNRLRIFIDRFSKYKNKKTVSLCCRLFMVSECKNRVMLTVYTYYPLFRALVTGLP